MGWEWDKVCGKWELRRGSGKKSVHTVTSKHLQKALIAFKFISHAIINCTAILLGSLSLQVDI